MIVGKVGSSNINCDSPFEHVRQRSEVLLCQEIDYAIHLSIDKVMIDFPEIS